MALSRNDDTTVTETSKDGVTRYVFDDTRVYKIAAESFPGHFTNIYLILDGNANLVDVAYSGENARADLKKGFEVINGDFNEDVGLDDVTGIFVTHGHGDHFWMLEHSKLKGKKVYIHPLDSALIRDYPTEYSDWKASMEELAKESGWDINPEDIHPYTRFDVGPGDYEVIEVTDGQRIVNGYQVYHTPGHTVGHICLRVGPVLFLGDHMLSQTTPHQVPKSGWLGAGLAAYLSSLKKVANLGIELGLPAHEDAIYSVKRRAEEIRAFHYLRLTELVESCKKGNSLYQLTDDYYRSHPEFIQVSSIGELLVDERLLALEEIKAHVEYLLEDDRLMVSSIDNGVVRYCPR